MGKKVRSGERKKEEEERKNTSENNGIPSSVWRTQHGRTNYCIFTCLDSFPFLSNPCLSSFVYISCLSDPALNKLNNHKVREGVINILRGGPSFLGGVLFNFINFRGGKYCF